MKTRMDHIKTFWNWIAAGWGMVIAWIAGHLPEIVAAERALTEFGRVLLVFGSLVLMWRQFRPKKQPEEDDPEG